MISYSDMIHAPKVEIDKKYITRFYLEEKDNSDYKSEASTSLERNRHKPCTKCDQPRHISVNDRCSTTLCTFHSTMANKRHKQREKYIESL